MDYLPQYVKIFNHKFYYRRKIPKAISELWGLPQIKKPLSSDIGEAAQMAHDITLLINSAIQDGTMEASNNLLKHIDLLLNKETAKIARESEKLMEHLDKKNASIPVEKVTVAHSLELWLQYHRNNRRNSEGTLYKYDDISKEIKWTFGAGTDVRAITDTIVKAANTFFCSGKVASFERRKLMTPNGALRLQEPYVSDRYVASKLAIMRAWLRWLNTSRLTLTDMSDQLPGPVIKEIAINKKTSFTDDEISYMHQMLLQYKDMAAVRVSDGRIRDWRWRYWVFILGLYTGARPVEVCQLSVSDILPPESRDPRGYQETLGCWCFWISNLDKDGNQIARKKVKNAHSYRLIPMHPWLINNGFLAYYESRKVNGQGLLFDLTPDRYQGYRKPADKVYNEDIIRPAKAKGLIHQGVTWACTRHNAETQIAHVKGMGYNERRIWRSIVGRVRDYDDPVESEYTDDYLPLKKLEIIKLLNYNI